MLLCYDTAEPGGVANDPDTPVDNLSKYYKVLQSSLDLEDGKGIKHSISKYSIHIAWD